jgi:integrase
MGKHRIALLVGLVILIAMGGIVFLRGLKSNGSNSEVIAASIPDPEEMREIQATIVEAYKVGYMAHVTHDVSQFPSVFVDDPSVPLTPEQKEQLRRWLGTVPEDAGYLTYGIAGYYNTERLNRLSQEAWAKARAAGRDYLIPEDYLTPDELREIEKSGGPIPTPPPVVYQPSMSAEEYVKWKWENIRFDSVVIKGDKAIVIYDDHWFLYEDILVRRGGKWYVAGHKRIGVSRW